MMTRLRALAALLGAMAVLGPGTGLAQDDIDRHRDCADCGMDRKAYGYSRMLIGFRDGSEVGVCSLHCAVVELDRGPRREPAFLKVADRDTRRLINAETAVWVVGGRKRGVMTKLPKWAFATAAGAEKFVKANGGAIVPFAKAVAAAREELAPPAAAAPADLPPFPKPGEKIPLGAGHYFVYGFDKPPKIGTRIMRVEIFSRDGAPDTSFAVRGDADMPSMRGAHSTGEKDFALSAKGVYLMPVQLVMPGDWEVRIVFLKDGKTVLRGVYLFDF